MAKWCTVALIHPDYVDSEEEVLAQPFLLAQDVQIGPVPSWLKQDRTTAYIELYKDRKETIEEARLAFWVEYEADSLGDPDPEWPGSRQARANESILFANLALWLAKPSRMGFELIIHCPTIDGTYMIQQCAKTSHLAPHPENCHNSLAKEDFELGRILHSGIAAVPRRGAVWTAIGPLWTALCEKKGNIRYLFLWIALEALFGPDDPRETFYRLSHRIAIFLASDKTQRKEILTDVKHAYRLRSKVVHGMKLGNLTKAKSGELMLKTEELLRRAMARILADSDLVEIFSSKNRESYLEDIVLGV